MKTELIGIYLPENTVKELIKQTIQQNITMSKLIENIIIKNLESDYTSPKNQ